MRSHIVSNKISTDFHIFLPISFPNLDIMTFLNSYVNFVSFLRFLSQFLILFMVHLTSISMFRFIASLFRTMVASITAGSIAIMITLLFCGFVIPKRKTSYAIVPTTSPKIIEVTFFPVCFIAASMPSWLKWGFYLSPLTYGEIGLTVNEFLAPTWEKVNVRSSTGNFSREMTISSTEYLLYL